MQLRSSQPQTRIYKVFGVSSQKILDKRAVQTRPITTVDDFDMDRDMTDQATTKLTSSVTALNKPPVVKPKLSVVNARSAAAKLVLRHLCRQSSAEAIRLRSASLVDDESEQLAGPPTVAKQPSRESSLSSLRGPTQHTQQRPPTSKDMAGSRHKLSLLQLRASKDTVQSTEYIKREDLRTD